MRVTLEIITRDTFDAVIALRVAESQQGFVATNLFSLAQAAVIPQYLPRAICADGLPMGFVMYGFDAEEDAFCISRLMIDSSHQGKGYGRLAMALVLADIRTREPKRDVVYISFKPANTAARALYESLGFVPDGRQEDGETIYRLQL